MSISPNANVDTSTSFSTGCLPDLALFTLSDLSTITLSGDDSVSFLQGQVTCDVTSLGAKQRLLGAHCNPKGKLWSIFWLLNYHDSLVLITNHAAQQASLAELKKYGVFSKTEIADGDPRFALFGLAGDSAEQALTRVFGAVPSAEAPILQVEGGAVIWLESPVSRYLLLLEQDGKQAYVDAIGAEPAPASLWEKMEIAAGWPQLSAEHLDEFIPQMLNLQALGAISFNKGCYSGQETVARMRYLGRNKRALFRLTGTAAETLKVDDELEMQLGDSWRRAGKIIRHVQEDEKIDLLAVLPNDLAAETVLRLRAQPDSRLAIVPLPYSIDE